MTTNAIKKPPARSVMGRVKSSYPRILRLLVPLDFSGKSRQALRYAIPLAQKFRARIVLLHVVVPANTRSRDAAAIPVERQKEEALARLEKMGVRLLPGDVRAQNLVRCGRPADVIVDTASKINADMIIMTTHGRTGLSRFFLGSTAEQVMSRAG
jgi:nucleotide-binding universal stress UspA family protein